MRSTLKHAVIGILFVLPLLFGSYVAHAAGALAIDNNQGDQYGFSYGHPNLSAASRRALSECGNGCSVVLRFNGECGAYAADQTKGASAYGWGTAATGPAAQGRAMAECRANGGAACLVRAWGCDPAAPEAADKLGAKPATPAPTTQPEVARAAPSPMLLGDWNVEYTQASGGIYSGRLQVTEQLSESTYRGVMVLSYTTADGVAKRVQQTMMINVRGSTVTLAGVNPVYLQGSGNYSPDTYTTTLSGAGVLRGTNRDRVGSTGAVVITKR